jgi:plasmid stabilization system protein ParE
MDLDDIRAWIAAERPMAAIRIRDRLRDAARKLDHHPERGRPISVGRRELTHVYPYLIRDTGSKAIASSSSKFATARGSQTRVGHPYPTIRSRPSQ